VFVASNTQAPRLVSVSAGTGSSTISRTVWSMRGVRPSAQWMGGRMGVHAGLSRMRETAVARVTIMRAKEDEMNEHCRDGICCQTYACICRCSVRKPERDVRKDEQRAWQLHERLVRMMTTPEEVQALVDEYIFVRAEARRAAFAEVQAILVQPEMWEERVRRALSLVTECRDALRESR